MRHPCACACGWPVHRRHDTQQAKRESGKMESNQSKSRSSLFNFTAERTCTCSVDDALEPVKVQPIRNSTDSDDRSGQCTKTPPQEKAIWSSCRSCSLIQQCTRAGAESGSMIPIVRMRSNGSGKNSRAYANLVLQAKGFGADNRAAANGERQSLTDVE